jgi:hypothetical protein
MNTTLNQTRSFNLFIVVGIVIVLSIAALATKDVNRRTAIIPNTSGSPFTAQSVPEAGAQGLAAYLRAHSSPSAQAVPDAAVQGVTGYLQAHSMSPLITDPAAKSVMDYLRAHGYGVLPEPVAQFSAVQLHREYILGERYGVMPQQYALSKTYRSPLDECFDVGLIYRAQCLSESQKPTP